MAHNFAGDCTRLAPGAAAARLLCLLLSLSTLAACSLTPWRPSPVDAEVTRCRTLFAQVLQVVRQHGVGDAQHSRVAGFDYLRSNRTLAALSHDLHNEAQWHWWSEQLRRLGHSDLGIEIANLPSAPRAQLQDASQRWLNQTLMPALESCSVLLLAQDTPQADRRQQLRQRVQVPMDYSLIKRGLGLYPLAAIPFSLGVQRMQARLEQLFADSVALRPNQSNYVYYAPPVPAQPDARAVAAMLKAAAANALAVPTPSQADLQQLYARFAPTFAVEQASSDDQIGAPHWTLDRRLQIDTTSPSVYTLASHARVKGQTLLQLNYVIWFPARPPSRRVDLLAGFLDGLIWRVTLDQSGEALLYDTIHSCGCYHQFFPSERLRPRAKPPALEEWAFVPARLGAAPPSTQLVVYLQAGTHYVRKVAFESASAKLTPYAWADYNTLRSLPQTDGSRASMFGRHGLIAGSERGERFLFWPMGIASAGAMRQWGRHATAFVGVRHFDDADLIERYFETNRAAPARSGD